MRLIIFTLFIQIYKLWKRLRKYIIICIIIIIVIYNLRILMIKNIIVNMIS